MDFSPLGRVPPEVRESIYQRVLLQREELTMRASTLNLGLNALSDKHWESDEARLRWTQAARNTLTLTRTCRISREECLPFLYGENTFIYEVDVPQGDFDLSQADDWLKPLENWLSVRTNDFELLRKFELRFVNTIEFSPYDRKVGLVKSLKMVAKLFAPEAEAVVCALDLSYVKDCDDRSTRLTSPLRIPQLTAEAVEGVRLEHFVGPARELHRQMKNKEISMQVYSWKVVELPSWRRYLESFLKHLASELEGVSNEGPLTKVENLL